MSTERVFPVDDPDVKAAVIEELKARAAKAQAEAEQVAVERLIKEMEAEASRLDLEKARKVHDWTMAGDGEWGRYNFRGEVNATSVDKTIDWLGRWSRIHPGADLEIRLFTPGGSVVDGLALFDFICELRRSGHRITTFATGYAASMGSILLQAGDWRVMSREAHLLVHQVQAAMMGSWGDIKDRTAWLERIQERILDIYGSRCAGASAETAVRRLSRAQIKRRWERTDWWIDSKDALAYGLVDEVR